MAKILTAVMPQNCGKAVEWHSGELKKQKGS
jgi:hypothetical protein